MSRQPRGNQFQCPWCESWGCPCNGSRRTKRGRVRNRRCSNPECGKAFATIERAGREFLLNPPGAEKDADGRRD